MGSARSKRSSPYSELKFAPRKHSKLMHIVSVLWRLGFFGTHGCCLLQFFYNLQNPVSPYHRIIQQKTQFRGVLQYDSAPNQPLDTFPVLAQQRDTPFLLLRSAQDTDEHDC